MEVVKMKKLLSLLLVITLLLSLAGCGKNSEGGQATSSTKKDQQEDITIRFALWDYENSGLQPLIERYEAENEGIKIDVLDISAKEYGDKLAIMLAGGETIDTFFCKTISDLGGYVTKEQIDPLDTYIEADKIDTVPYGATMDTVNIDDKIYGLPYRKDFWLLFYNKNMFDKHGIDYPTKDMTWDDYREVAKQLTSGEGPTKEYGTYIHTWASVYFLQGLQKNMGDLVSGDYVMLKDGLELLKGIQLEDKSAQDYATNKSMGSHYAGMMEKGNVGMLYMGTWQMSQFAKMKSQGISDEQYNWSVAPMPTWTKDEAEATIGGVSPMLLSTTSKHKEETWEFIKFVSGEEGAKHLADLLIMPAFINEAVMDRFVQNEYFPEDGKIALETEHIFMEWPSDKLSPLLSKMVDEEIQLVVTGNKSIDDAIADMESRRDEIIEQNK